MRMATTKGAVQGGVKGTEPGSDPRVGLATVNEVHLVGRVSATAVERRMPSGDVLTSFRVVVDRVEPGDGPRRRVDAVDCHTWSGRVRQQAAGWHDGDVVDLSGALRRRFFRTAAGTQSMTEVEVVRARMVRRAASG
jgi:single-strand DNA-binding protein